MNVYEIKDFALDNQSLLLHETIFHNANGYLGVRGNFEEGYREGYDSIRGMYLNGFYEFIDMPQAEKLCGLVEEKQTMLNVADTQGIELWAENEKFSMFDGTVLEKERVLDMDAGVTVRRVVWCSPAGRKMAVEIRRMASFYILPLFLIEYHVTPLNFDGTLKFISAHKGEVQNYSDPDDPRVGDSSEQHLHIRQKKAAGGHTCIEAGTVRSGLTLCTAVHNELEKEDTGARELDEIPDGYVERLSARYACGETAVFRKYTIVCDSLRFADPVQDAAGEMTRALGFGADALYREQAAYLKRFWENCAIHIEGDERLDAAVHYNLYQLIQSAGKDPCSNIAAKGLSGEGYEGHYFWDTEMYLQPFFTLTSREVARNLIEYRYRTMEYARENARKLGHKKGVAYPWRTIMGKECSGYFPSGSAAYHISGDVAYSVSAYYLATGDIRFLAECGAEILIEVARLWADIGNYYDGKFHINTVTGPDEYTCLVNNNYYTNSLAKYNLHWAVKAYRILEEAGMQEAVRKKTGISREELKEFERISGDMYLPYDSRLGINPQDDSFLQKRVWRADTVRAEEKPLLLHYHPMLLYRYQICKQADTVLAYFILEDAQDLETMRRSFEYYEQITTHDSSLSSCIFSIMASRLGFEEKAFQYFGESAEMDLFNTHGNTKDGIHTANMGGTYMAIVYGFGGLRIKEDGLSVAPSLPAAWNSYQFRILYEDSQIEVRTDRAGCRVTLLAGSPKPIRIYGREYLLENSLTAARAKSA